MAESSDRIRFRTQSAGDAGLSKTRSHVSLPDARANYSDKDIEVASSSGVWQVEDRDVKRKQVFKGWLLLWLAYQSTGVIYGDIGTSPLYVYSSTFTAPPSPDDLLGALSLIIWTLTLIVTVKYVFIVLRADDLGEGGTFAVYSLLSRYSNIATRDRKTMATTKLERYDTNEMGPANLGLRNFLEKSKWARGFLQALSVFGVSLIMADGVLTPAQSVLGAIQGLNVVSSNITSGTIVGVTCGILVLLFLLQPLGIHKLASAFAPIVIVWLLFNATFGIYNLVVHDASVLKAFSPWFAGNYFVRNGTNGWLSLGGILLAFTGVEALFADLGAFSMRAVQISWVFFAYPCLLLAYIGQAAYIMDDPSAYSNPFFNSVPPGMFWPSLIVAILAAIVASQAIITGTFQLITQLMNMSYCFQLEQKHLSSRFHGQVYVPVANWLLMIGTVIVSAVYSNTTKLGEAYGVCVILVTFITTNVVAIVALVVWRLHPVIVFAVWLPFACLDGLYLSSALTKFPNGAWFTLLLAAILASIFVLWRFGKESQWAAEARDRLPTDRVIVPAKPASTGSPGEPERLHPALGGAELTTIKGLGIFFDKAGDAVPTVFVQFLQKFEARPSVFVCLHLRALSIPTVLEEEKYVVTRAKDMGNCYRIIARHGYNDAIVTNELANVVYHQIRKFLVRTSPKFRNASKTGGGAAPEVSGPPEFVPRMRDRTRSNELEISSTPIPTLEIDEATDEATARALMALDKAFMAQTVYIVGKEQLRITWPAKRSMSDYVGPRAFRRLCLMLFLWIRENTRAKAASMKIPIEKLVEIGFVKEM